MKRSMSKIIAKANKKATGKNKEEEEDEECDDEDLVYRVGTAVYFNTDVHSKSVSLLRKKLFEASEQALKNSNTLDTPRVALYINSEGGDVLDGLAASSLIKNNMVDTITIADGFVASSATLLFLAGKTRLATKGTRILIHQLSSVAAGTLSEIEDETANCKKLMKYLKNFYLKTTTFSEEELDEVIKNEKDLGLKECKRFGIVHSSLESFLAKSRA